MLSYQENLKDHLLKRDIILPDNVTSQQFSSINTYYAVAKASTQHQRVLKLFNDYAKQRQLQNFVSLK